MRSPINQPICTRCLLMLVFMLMSLGISAQSQVRWGDPTSAAAFVEVNEWPMNWSNRGDAYPVLSNPNKATVTYSSSNTGVATIDANSGAISPVAPGSTTITASVVDAPSASYTLTYTDDRRELGNLGFGFSSTTASATYGDGTITPLSLTMGQLSGASVTYSSSVQSVATVDNAGSVTIKGAGSTEISASFAGDDYVKPGSASYTLTVNPKEVGLTWGTTSFIYDGSAHAPTATATGLVGNDACTVTVEGAKTDAGSNYIATASVLSNTNYKLPTDNTTTFSIAKAASSVTTAPTANTLTYSGSAQALVTAGAASGGTMQYSLDNQTFAESVPTGIKVGSYTVYYKVVGDANHENAEGGQVVVAIAKADATVTFASKTASGKMGEAFTAPKVTTSPADLTLAYASSNTKVATVDGSTGAVTLVAAGETTITASFAGNDNYNAANDSYTLTVAKADAVSSDLSFASETATATYGDATVTSPELTNPHQLPLTWNSSNKGVATVNASGVVTIVGAGETVISAAFAGNDTYGANTISYTLTVNKAAASVAFASKTASGKMGETFTAPKVTTSPADLTLAYTSSNTKVATVDPSTGAVTLVSAGETTITASFAGNDNYNAANDSYTLTVAKADAVNSDLSFASATATATYGDATVTSPTLNNPHQLPLTWSSSNKDVATVNASGVVTIVGAGETVISAAFAGNDTYGANTISYTLTVNKYQPKITFASTSVTVKLGEDFTPPKVTTDPKELEFVYTSSDENVAKVDASSGEVVIVGSGTTRITATFNATRNYHYASSYYDLTVEDNDYLLDPIEEDKDYKMEAKYFINDDGTEVDLSNVIINDILFTLKNQNSPEGDGFDPDLDCIVLNTVVAASAVNSLVEKGLLPGTDEYAEEFTGLTFLMPAGEGEIIVTSQELNGVYLMVKVGKEKPVAISMPEMGDYSIPYKSNAKTYVYLWNGGTNANGTRGKKSMTDARVRRVSYKSAASDIQQVIGELTDDERWYNLNGLRITRPTKKGVYIHGSRKVVIK